MILPGVDPPMIARVALVASLAFTTLTTHADAIVRRGGTATQTRSILGEIARELAAAGLGMGDVAKMNVVIVEIEVAAAQARRASAARVRIAI